MRLSHSIVALVATGLLGACASYPVPAQRMAAAEAATRSAEETGANDIPQAQLHVRLAREELARARALMTDGDNKRADFVLIRAKSDAELALGEAREQKATAEAAQLSQQVAALQSQVASGATTTSATTTTTTTPAGKP